MTAENLEMTAENLEHNTTPDDVYQTMFVFQDQRNIWEHSFRTSGVSA